MPRLPAEKLRIQYKGLVVVHSLEASFPHLTDDYLILREESGGNFTIEHQGRASSKKFDTESGAFLRAVTRARYWIDVNFSPLEGADEHVQ